MTKIVGFREIFDAVVDDELTGERFASALIGRKIEIVYRLGEMLKVATSKRAEDQRRSRLLRSDRMYAKEEIAREAAQLEIRSGVYVSVSDAVIPPTPEWLAKHDTMPVTVQADGEGHHARSVKTVRRVVTSHVTRAHQSGKIDDRQFKACVWYRDRHEECGLDGRLASARFNQRVSGGTGGGVVFTDRQVEALDDLWRAYAAITPAFRKFFEMVVVDDIGLKRASRIAKCRRHPFVTLRSCADEVADHLGL